MNQRDIESNKRFVMSLLGRALLGAGLIMLGLEITLLSPVITKIFIVVGFVMFGLSFILPADETPEN